MATSAYDQDNNLNIVDAVDDIIVKNIVDNDQNNDIDDETAAKAATDEPDTLPIMPPPDDQSAADYHHITFSPRLSPEHKRHAEGGCRAQEEPFEVPL